MDRDSTADAWHGTQEGAALRQRARLGKVGGRGGVFAGRGQVRESPHGQGRSLYRPLLSHLAPLLDY